MNGILNIDKPSGITSHDVVDRVRRALKTRRVGHAGTLDPLATGVLVVCVGNATRISEYVMAGEKEYAATIRFGETTDTYDAEGVVVARAPVELSRDDIERALADFLGDIEQVPPVYSAIKVGGTPLHRRARKGEAVTPKPRSVTIHDIAIEGWISPDIAVRIRCSPGTYIRSFAHDLGERLGCGAHLARLERRASGNFSIDDAITLEALTELARSGTTHDALRPMEDGLAAFPAVTVDDELSRAIGHGREVTLDAHAASDGELVQARGAEGKTIALLRYDASRRAWRPRKVFAAGIPASPAESRD